VFVVWSTANWCANCWFLHWQVV